LEQKIEELQQKLTQNIAENTKKFDSFENKFKETENKLFAIIDEKLKNISSNSNSNIKINKDSGKINDDIEHLNIMVKDWKLSIEEQLNV